MAFLVFYDKNREALSEYNTVIMQEFDDDVTYDPVNAKECEALETEMMTIFAKLQSNSANEKDKKRFVHCFQNCVDHSERLALEKTSDQTIEPSQSADAKAPDLLGLGTANHACRLMSVKSAPQLSGGAALAADSNEFTPLLTVSG